MDSLQLWWDSLDFDWSFIDWSFIVMLVLLVFVTTALLVLRAQARRRARLEERRAARRAYQSWLRNSGLHPIALPPRASRRRRG